MRNEEKRRKFHEALLKTLYPQIQAEEDAKRKGPVSTENEGFDVNLIPEDYGLQQNGPSSSGDDGDGAGDEGGLELETLKLSRVQRKRIRTRKIKEDISRRGKIIGPLPALSSNDGKGNCSGAGEERTPDVRQNADQDDCRFSAAAASNKPGGVNQSKLKQRRMAKRLARERLKSSIVETGAQDQTLCSPTKETCDQD